MPTATAVTPLATIGCGVWCWPDWGECPICHALLEPQQCSPVRTMAQVLRSSVTTSVTPEGTTVVGRLGATAGPPGTPTWPLKLRPQHSNAPLATAQVCRAATTWVTPSAMNVVGVSSVWNPDPLVSSMKPQHCNAPPTTAQVCCPPVATAVTPLASTWVGLATGRLATPVPTCPSRLLPQHLSAPLTTAQVFAPPAATAVTPASITRTGLETVPPTLPVPICPSPLSPQHSSAPDAMAQVCADPVATCVTPPSSTVRATLMKLAREPVPNWPCPLLPTQRKAPPCVTAQPCPSDRLSRATSATTPPGACAAAAHNAAPSNQVKNTSLKLDTGRKNRDGCF